MRLVVFFFLFRLVVSPECFHEDMQLTDNTESKHFSDL